MAQSRAAVMPKRGACRDLGEADGQREERKKQQAGDMEAVAPPEWLALVD